MNDDENDLTDELEDADCLEDQLDLLLRRDCMDCGRYQSCVRRSQAHTEEMEQE